MTIANTARPRMRPPPPLLEGEELEHGVGSVGRRHDREREPGEQQDQHVDVAQRRAGARSRTRSRATLSDQARDANGGELHRARKDS